MTADRYVEEISLAAMLVSAKRLPSVTPEVNRMSPEVQNRGISGLQKFILKQECIPEGCVPSAAVAISERGCLPKGVCVQGVCVPRGCVSSGVCASQHAVGQTPPPDRILDTRL